MRGNLAIQFVRSPELLCPGPRISLGGPACTEANTKHIKYAEYEFSSLEYVICKFICLYKYKVNKSILKFQNNRLDMLNGYIG